MFRKNALLAAMFSCALVPSVMAQSPYEKPDDSWISISGTAIAADEDSFVLDYGESTVLVEMDDWDWYGDNYGVLEGDKVTVYGRVDDDLFEATKIEAGSVYVESLGTYFYANPADEEGVAENTALYNPVVVPVVEIGEVTLTGTVTSVDGREFTVDTGKQKVTVDTVFMGYNPMDDLGFQQIDKGDVVSVTGDLDVGTFENREISAEFIVTLDDSGKKK